MAADGEETDVDSILLEYFYSWRPYKVIVKRLEKVHGLNRSVSWLKQQYRRMGLKRRQADPNRRLLKTLIRKVHKTSRKLYGYRALWKYIRDKYKCIVRRNTVMKMVKELDPEGVISRRKHKLRRRVYKNKGPNFLWHIDGYDKLKPFGIAIHGCIDGFSRRMLWLKAAPTNSDPRLIARYYLECVEEAAGCPMLLRSDYGTENCIVAAIHVAFNLKNNSTLKDKSYIYGPSKSNVRIEGWWSQLRRFKTSWWIDMFKSILTTTFMQDLKDRNEFDGSSLHQQALLYSTVHLLEKELDEFAKHWNSHRIRVNNKACCPAGIPDDLYEMPEAYGCSDYLQPADSQLWTHGMANETIGQPAYYSNSFARRCDQLLQQSLNICHRDITTQNCFDVYLFLVNNL